ncbi:MAG: TadE/TadG family type IV pilus assembly protein, partial [Marmoricola sp.]
MRSSLSRRRDEAGAVAILVALSLTLILIVAAMVLDFGLVRVDRQVDKSAADAATLAGLHALNGGDASPRPFAGVCGAINYLQQNNDRFAAMTPAAGAWSDGASPAAAIAGNPCTDTTLLNQACSPGSPSTWAKFTWTATLDSQPFAVVVQSGYQLSTTSGYGEDSIQAAQADNDDSAQGCDQLAVLIDQQRAPGLGSLASTTDLRTSIRSVGRVKQDTGGYAPAMLLLEQKTCPVLESGSNSGGSFIHVLGAEASDGTTQPGTIHSDSDASVSCSGGSNQNLFLGKGNDGVVAYAAPLAGSPGSADASKPGQLTSYAGLLNKALKFIIDNDSTRSSSYAATGVNTASPGTHKAPTGLPRVTRKPVDSRYFTGVKGAISAASTIFTGVTPTTALGLGYKVLSGCSATQADVDALSLTATSWLYVDCNGAFSGPNGALNIPAQRIVFRGSVAPQRIHTYGNATQVYING